MRVRKSGSLHALAWLVWFVTALAACTSSVPEGQCEFDVHCAGGQVCVDHYCRSTCRQDSDCPAAHQCRAADTTGSSSGCVPLRMAMPCVRDGECSPGQACLQGQCRAQCREDYDCRALNPFNQCMGGACVLVCAPRLTDNCDRTVVNGCEVRIDRDAAHCGACGRACPSAPHARGACADSACTFACDRGWANCDGVAANGCEVDLSRAESCGACGVSCAAPRSLCAEVTDPSGASSYACTDRCAEPTPDRCGDTCTRRATDPRNCGDCGAACAAGPRSEPVCAAGACSLRCTDPRYADCDRAAANGCEADLETSPTSCGACGRACAAAPHATAACAAGACALVCEAGWADCDGMMTNGCEADLRASTDHCGMCSRPCSGGADARCEAGSCRVLCPPMRGDCDGDAANGCETDLTVSAQHCGACGTRCAFPGTGARCAAARCEPTGMCSSATLGDCDGNAANGCESDLTNSLLHCGACGNACSLPNATPVCADGRCRVGACNAGFADCDGNPSNGCEVALATTADHCGACGNACPRGHGAPSCAAGACRIVCDAGYGDCDGVAANGCETSTATTAAHCGGCGRSCAPANAVASCSSGVCGVAACLPGFADCDGSAANGCEVTLATSAAHCGACGRACSAAGGTASCAMGACRIACSAGFGDCDGSAANGCEVSLAASLPHCGACGAACAPPSATGVCAAGACGVAACNAGRANCDGAAANGCEVDLASSAAHCGACGNACMAGWFCRAGACARDCGALTACGAACVDLRTSAANCGRCGNACSFPNAAAVCAAGACALGACNAGFGDCDGVASNGCETSLATATAHCGACGAACNATGGAASCAGGACAIACSAGFGNCDGVASNGCEVDLRTSPSNCGRCGGACAVPNATPACAAGACAVGTCTGEFADCDRAVGNGCEANLATSNAHCGACGRACATGQVCSARVCASICAPPTAFCGGRCFDLQTDPSNCGACGTVCPPRANAVPTCARGGCGFACNAGFGDCDGVAANGCETNLATTPAHCGACGASCNGTNGAATCGGGVCGIVCNAGFGNCDGSAANGCEVTLATSASHCGACGNACSLANATPACAAGACVVGSCNAGFGNCDGVAANGCETNTGSTPAHCGACGAACNATNGAATCAASACGITCNAGFGNCDGLVTNGCETSTATTVAHCGGCGRACALPNATPVCAAGACAVGACNAGFGNCDGVAANGCETNLASSTAHCGACNNACRAGFFCGGSMCMRDCGSLTNCSNSCVNLQTDPVNCGSCGATCSFANATPACAAGACAIGACNAGFGNCDGVASNGCEVTLATSASHCGACGNACPAPTNGTASCVASGCRQACNPGYYAVSLGMGILCAPLPAPPQVAPGSFMMATSRRPTFRWVVGGPINGARLQVCNDRACGSVVLDTTVTGTSFTPAADLPVGRLWWRLFGRAGTNEGTTASPVWQVYVTARTAARSSAFGAVFDANGDGFTDAIVGSTGLTAYVYHGSSTGLGASPARTYTGASGSDFGVSVAAAGDVNGDGYGDAIVGAPGLESAYVYYGSATGLGTRVTIPSPVVRSGFGSSVSWAGDVNDDGYGDVVVGACWTACANAAYVFLGSSSGIATTPARTLTAAGATGFGRFVYGVGELNNDALDDVVVVGGATSYVFYGAAAPSADAVSLTNLTGVAFGWDTNGDGYSDLALASRTFISASTVSVRVYYGSAGGIGVLRPFSFTSTPAGYGAAIAGLGDVNGDGYGEVAWSTQGTNVRVAPGSTSGPNAAAITTIPATVGRGGYGQALAGVGDTNGDGRWDLLVAEPDFGTEFVCAHYTRLYRGSASGVAATPVYSTTLPAGGSCADFGSDLAP